MLTATDNGGKRVLERQFLWRCGVRVGGGRTILFLGQFFAKIPFSPFVIHSLNTFLACKLFDREMFSPKFSPLFPLSPPPPPPPPPPPHTHTQIQTTRTYSALFLFSYRLQVQGVDARKEPKLLSFMMSSMTVGPLAHPHLDLQNVKLVMRSLGSPFSPGIILDQPRTNCNKRFFLRISHTHAGTIEHHIKMYQNLPLESYWKSVSNFRNSINNLTFHLPP